MAEGRKEEKRDGDAGSVADLARRRTTAALPVLTGYVVHNITKKNVKTTSLKNTTRT